MKPIRRSVETLREILDRVLDKGIVIDAWLRASMAGIDLVTRAARLVVTSPAGVAPTAGPAPARVVHEAFDAWNGHDIERYTALLDDRYVGETYRAPSPLRGRAAAREAMARYFQALPDFHFDVEGAVVTGDDVLVSWLARGTPGGGFAWAGTAARQLTVPGCTVTRLRDGKIIHTWDYWDWPASA